MRHTVIFILNIPNWTEQDFYITLNHINAHVFLSAFNWINFSLDLTEWHHKMTKTFTKKYRNNSLDCFKQQQKFKWVTLVTSKENVIDILAFHNTLNKNIGWKLPLERAITMNLKRFFPENLFKEKYFFEFLLTLTG